MATEREMRTAQKRALYMLLTIKARPEKLKDFITQMLAEMDEEDIALVEKRIAEERG